MNILVTGGAGFIASHLSDALVEEGNKVTVVDNLSTGSKENLNSSCRFREMDIRDGEMDSIFRDGNFDSVFHLAAQMDVRKSVKDPLFDADVNVMGGINLLENSRKHGVEKFIFASSGGVMYGECPDSSPDEKTYPQPMCPYGSSKLAFEFYLDTFRHNYRMTTVSMRFANVYGPRQDACGEAGVVAIFSSAMLGGGDVRIFGDGSQLRDYVYVKDVVDACLKAHRSGRGVYNIGTGDSKSVNQLFQIMKKETSYKKQPRYEPPRRGEIKSSRMNTEKARRELGWKAETDLRQGLGKTLKWFESARKR